VGVRDRFGFFDYVGHAAAFWSATTAGKSFAWAYFLGEANPGLARMNLMMPYGLSVRCVH
jgi:phage tail protein X